MIIIALNGWSASVRPENAHISTVVHRVLMIEHVADAVYYSATARLCDLHAARVRRWVRRRQLASETLLVVGKSLGGWTVIVDVLNKMPRLNFRKIGLITVDPCHPKLWDWCPDRSADQLSLHSGRVDMAVNLRSGSGHRPAGAQVLGAQDVVVPKVDHYSIVQSQAVDFALRSMVGWLEEGQP